MESFIRPTAVNFIMFSLNRLVGAREEIGNLMKAGLSTGKLLTYYITSKCSVFFKFTTSSLAGDSSDK